MNQKPVYQISAKGNEIAHMGWATDQLNAQKIASAFGHPRGIFQDGYHGSLGEGFGYIPKAAPTEV